MTIRAHSKSDYKRLVAQGADVVPPEPVVAAPPAKWLDFSSLGLVTEGDAHSFAVFNPDHTRRYLLGRLVDDYFDGDEFTATRPLAVWVMLNPSKAGAYETDPTNTKCTEFTRRLRCGGHLIVNLSSWIATDPRELSTVQILSDEANQEMVRRALHNPLFAVRICAWGRMANPIRRRLVSMMSIAKCHGALWSFGKTKDGEPRHPVRLPYRTELRNMADGRLWQ